jgi:hypothetical protein
LSRSFLCPEDRKRDGLASPCRFYTKMPPSNLEKVIVNGIVNTRKKSPCRRDD